MKKHHTILMTSLLLLLSSTALLSSCTKNEKTQEQTYTDEDTWELIRKAYTYAFPLVLTDSTKTLSTNTVEATNTRAPINQFIHANTLADSDTRVVVTPNVDTIYTQAWLDISTEPMLYTVPETDRFFNVQVLDAWTNTSAVLQQPGIYALTLPEWEGELPNEVTRIDVPTATVWTIARILLSGEEDLPNVFAIQEQMKLTPLSAYLSDTDYVPSKGTYNENNEFVPLEKVLSMQPKEFFDTANALMQVNPPAVEDNELLEELASINIGPGMNFNASCLGEDAEENWKLILSELRSTLIAEGNLHAQTLGQWIYYGRPIGDFGTAYTYRALIALAGLGANTVDIAIYPKTDVDETGAELTGGKTYLLHFENMPPTLEGGFWSVTAYGNDDYLIDNPLNRYCINDRSDFVLNDDGSLDIILAKEQPENIQNWLPVSEDTFHLFMRIYLPDMDALTNWQPPVIRVQ